MIAAGIDVPYSCKEGRCGSCAATVVRGEVDMATCDILEPDDLADGVILACQRGRSPTISTSNSEPVHNSFPLTGNHPRHRRSSGTRSATAEQR